VELAWEDAGGLARERIPPTPTIYLYQRYEYLFDKDACFTSNALLEPLYDLRMFDLDLEQPFCCCLFMLYAL
jgi:hypothetical protein